MKFSSFALSPQILSAISDKGYTDATPLTGDTLDDLEEVLDIVKFYEPTSFTVVNASSNGWNDGKCIHMFP